LLTTICRAYLAVLSIYHVATGVVSFCFPGFALRLYKRIYACDPAERRQLTMVMKPWGALSVSAGISGCFCAADPVRYWGVVAALWFLMVLRITYRVLWRHELGEVGRIPPHRNFLNVAMIAIGVAVLGAWLLCFMMGGKVP